MKKGLSSRGWDCEDSKLELRLAPPGDEDWEIKKECITETCENTSSAFLSLGCFNGSFQENSSKVLDDATVSPWSRSCSQYKQSLAPAVGKESIQNAEKRGFSPAPANNTAVHKSSQKRCFLDSQLFLYSFYGVLSFFY